MEPADAGGGLHGRPALHRFPADMARRTQELCAAVAERYGDDASRIWREAADGQDLEARLLALPGIGEMKARTLVVILRKRFGVRLPGCEVILPPTRRSATSIRREALAAYQAQKRAYKQALKAARPALIRPARGGQPR